MSDHATRLFPVKRGDTRPYLQVQILNPDGSPYDLTGHVVTFRMGLPGQARKVDGGNVTIVQATAGIVEERWQAGDLDTIGEYRAEFVIDGNDTYPKDGYVIVKVEERV